MTEAIRSTQKHLFLSLFKFFFFSLFGKGSKLLEDADLTLVCGTLLDQGELLLRELRDLLLQCGDALLERLALGTLGRAARGFRARECLQHRHAVQTEPLCKRRQRHILCATGCCCCCCCILPFFI